MTHIQTIGSPPPGRRKGAGPVVLAAVLSAMLTALVLPLGGAARTQAAPANTELPTITGTAVKDSTLVAGTGSWSGTTPISFAFQWQRCDDAGANCADVSGATNTTFVLGSADVGKRMRVLVTASNADGAASALSAPTATVTESATPVNTGEPPISGNAVEGQTLAASSGTWTGGQPITYAYQWVRCGSNGGAPDGSNCAFISGATQDDLRAHLDRRRLAHACPGDGDELVGIADRGVERHASGSDREGPGQHEGAFGQCLMGRGQRCDPRSGNLDRRLLLLVPVASLQQLGEGAVRRSRERRRPNTD